MQYICYSFDVRVAAMDNGYARRFVFTFLQWQVSLYLLPAQAGEREGGPT